MAVQKDYYLNLRRSLFEHWVWDEKPFGRGQAWIDLIAKANVKYKKYSVNNKIIHLKRGDVFTSLDKLSIQWGWSRSKVRRFLDRLEADHMVARESTNNYTVISLINYKDLNKMKIPSRNGRRTADGQQTDSRRTADGQQTDTINQSLIDQSLINNKDQSSVLSNYKEGQNSDDDWFFISYKKITGYPVAQKEINLLGEVFNYKKENIERALAEMRKYKGRSIKYLLRVLQTQKEGPVKKPNLDKTKQYFHYGCTNPESKKKVGYAYPVINTKKVYCENCGMEWPDMKSFEIHKENFFKDKQ